MFQSTPGQPKHYKLHPIGSIDGLSIKVWNHNSKQRSPQSSRPNSPSPLRSVRMPVSSYKPHSLAADPRSTSETIFLSGPFDQVSKRTGNPILSCRSAYIVRFFWHKFVFVAKKHCLRTLECQQPLDQLRIEIVDVRKSRVEHDDGVETTPSQQLLRKPQRTRIFRQIE